MDQQHLVDLESIQASAANKKKTTITDCRQLLKAIRTLQSMKGYNRIWKIGLLIDLEHNNLQRKHLDSLIKMFNIAG